MRPNFRKLVLLLPLLTLSRAALAQQDLTVEWKSTLADLERRLRSLSPEGGSSVEAWRSDAESLRSSVAAFAASRPEIHVPVPPALSGNSPREALTPELNALTAAVDEVIRQTPGSAFHLGRVEVTVSAASTPSSARYAAR